MTRKLGKDLRVGDTIEVWWTPRRDTITSLSAYNGPLNETFAPHGAQIAGFALNKCGMTIQNGDYYNVIA